MFLVRLRWKEPISFSLFFRQQVFKEGFVFLLLFSGRRHVLRHRVGSDGPAAFVEDRREGVAEPALQAADLLHEEFASDGLLSVVYTREESPHAIVVFVLKTVQDGLRHVFHVLRDAEELR